MAEGNPPTRKKMIVHWVTERLRRLNLQQAAIEDGKKRKMKKIFSSAQWYYPVHKYIGDVVRGNKFRIDYEPKHKWICFQYYCDMVSEYIVHLDYNFKEIAVAMLRALPSDENVTQGIPLDEDPDTLIAEKDAIYLLGSYNLECFDYLLRSFAIGLKEKCIRFVEKQLQELIKKKPDLKEDVEAFVSRQLKKLSEQQQKTVDGIQGTCNNQYLSGIKRITPLPSIMSEEINPEEIPPVPKDPKDWKDYFIQVCNTRLTLTLAKEEQYYDKLGGSFTFLRTSMIGHFGEIRDIVENPGEYPRIRITTFNASTTRFREEISNLISEKH